MAYTSHGHQIPGSPKELPEPNTRARCGGPGLCKLCSGESSLYASSNYGRPGGFEPEIMPGDNTADYPAKAKALVKQFVDEMLKREGPLGFPNRDELPAYEIYIVTFAKANMSWKATVSTTLQDGMYYELSYDGYKRQTKITAFKKRETVIIPD